MKSKNKHKRFIFTETHTGNPEYSCHLCPRKFYVFMDFKRHLARHDPAAAAAATAAPTAAS